MDYIVNKNGVQILIEADAIGAITVAEIGLFAGKSIWSNGIKIIF